MDFRHPSAIHEQIARLNKRQHEVQTAMVDLGLNHPDRPKLMFEITLLTGILMALEWSACARRDLEEDCRKLIEGLP